MKQMVRKLLSIVITLIAVSFAVFAMEAHSLGDSSSYVLAEDAGGHSAEAYRASIASEESFSLRYIHFLADFLCGHWGTTVSGHDIAQTIRYRAGVTCSLALLSVLIALLIAFPLSMLSAEHRGVLSHAVSAFSVIIMSLPSFLTGLFLILIFSVGLGMFPSAGYTPPSVSISQWAASLMLPSLTLALLYASIIIRVFRKALYENADKPFTVSLIALGADKKTAIWKSALKPSLSVLYTLIASSLASAAAGSAVTESVFAIPGIGSLMVRAALTRDVRLAGTLVILIALAVSVIYTVLEIILPKADPRTGRE